MRMTFTITDEQAVFLREIRKGLASAIQTIQDKIKAVRAQCGHDEHNQSCPICDIYAKVEPESYVENALPEFAATIDAYLLRGPSV